MSLGLWMTVPGRALQSGLGSIFKNKNKSVPAAGAEQWGALLAGLSPVTGASRGAAQPCVRLVTWGLMTLKFLSS